MGHGGNLLRVVDMQARARFREASESAEGVARAAARFVGSHGKELGAGAALLGGAILAGAVRRRAQAVPVQVDAGMHEDASSSDETERLGGAGTRINDPETHTDSPRYSATKPEEPGMSGVIEAHRDARGHSKHELDTDHSYVFDRADLVILGPIAGGLSRWPVFAATFNGAHAVAKLMGLREFKTVLDLQCEYVVRVLYETDASLHVYPNDAYGSPVKGEGGDRLVVMEKLDPAGLYPTYSTLGIEAPIDTAYLASKTDRKFDVVALSSQRRKHLTDLLRAVAHLGDKGVVWGDLKEENMGIDSDGNLRIFDFGEASGPKPLVRLHSCTGYCGVRKACV
jgi:hypothetical protein